MARSHGQFVLLECTVVMGKTDRCLRLILVLWEETSKSQLQEQKCFSSFINEVKDTDKTMGEEKVFFRGKNIINSRYSEPLGLDSL